jgi:hypothetical protein
LAQLCGIATGNSGSTEIRGVSGFAVAPADECLAGSARFIWTSTLWELASWARLCGPS